MKDVWIMHAAIAEAACAYIHEGIMGYYMYIPFYGGTYLAEEGQNPLAKRVPPDRFR